MNASASEPRRIWAGLMLLDHQIVDRDGRLAGKVDDLELTDPEPGGAGPRLVALLSGPGALAGQIGGAAGRWLAAMEVRLAAPDHHPPARIPVERITHLDNAVAVDADAEQLDSNRAERWARDVVIDRIPGARHAAE